MLLNHNLEHFMGKVFDQDRFNRDTITAFLLAYPRKVVLECVRTLVVKEHRHKRALGWKLFQGTEQEIPQGMQRMSVKGLWYVRTSDDYVAEHGADPSKGHDKGRTPAHKREDAVVRKADIPCPACGSAMYREPICRGCREGKAGFRVRLICGEDDNHSWLV
jgi:hypothetical protein